VFVPTVGAERPCQPSHERSGWSIVVEQQVLRALVEFADPLAADPNEEAFLQRLCTRCTELFPVDAAVVHLSRDPQRRSMMAAMRPGAQVGGRLEELREGPVFRVLRTGEAVSLPDPPLVCVPLPGTAPPVAVLSLLGAEPPPLDAHGVAAVTALADIAGNTLAAARALLDARVLADQLRHALDSRVVVEQAKGVVAARAALDVEQALERLRRHARNHRRQLRDVARDVVEGRLILER
jgi:hypothetical protein